MEFVSYIRVSTKKQGQSGLGLEAQREIISNYVNGKGSVIAEYQDIESGTHRDRKGLWQAIDHAKRVGATLIIAKLDRLARDTEFILRIFNETKDDKSKMGLVFCDMPIVNILTLSIFGAVAQYERELTSKRTKDALQAKKNQGIKLGAPNATFTEDMRTKAIETRKANAEENSKKYLEYIHLRREKGDTLQEIASKCNEMGFRTPRGKEFTTSTIQRYLDK